jgi:hypothetical protein
MSDSDYTFSECHAWRLTCSPSDRRVYLTQEVYGEEHTVMLSLDQIPDLARALEKLHRDESPMRASK